MKRRITQLNAKHFVAALAISVGAVCFAVADAPGPPLPDAIWGDGTLYATVLTPTSLPDHGPHDGIYNFMGQAGQHSVAEAKPGDADYNGGRWDVTLVGFTADGLAFFDQDHDGQVDVELESWEEVEEAIGAGYVEVLGKGPQFVCPMIPQDDNNA